MEYAIEYEHLKYELVSSYRTNWHFKRVRDSANKNHLKLSDDDFKRFFKLQESDKDIEWLMSMMSAYDLSLADALISYITY